VTDANKAANIAAELARSETSLRAAKVLLDGDLPEDAVSRLYYAVFHAVVALLLTEGIDPRSHSALAGLLGQHFIRPGRLAAEDGRLVARMQKYRQEADYGRSFVVTTDAARGDLAECEALIAKIRRSIAAAGFGP
jgi:uncharacterized protein (UPF0332 family)